jgi:cytochrome c551/c552
MRAGIAIALAGLLLAVATAARADTYRGAGIALHYCVTCHVIDRRGTGPNFSNVPAFTDIALKPEATPNFLFNGCRNPTRACPTSS